MPLPGAVRARAADGIGSGALVAAGTPVTVICKRCGHVHLVTTIGYVDHLTNRRAIDMLEATILPEVSHG